MDAPIACVSAFAPESWIAKLPLAQFNAWSWLWGNAAASTKHINALSLIFLYPWLEIAKSIFKVLSTLVFIGIYRIAGPVFGHSILESGMQQAVLAKLYKCTTDVLCSWLF